MRWLCCHSLEEGVAEHAIGFCRTIEIADPCIECRGIDDAGRERLLPHGFNHPRERFPRETVDQIWCRRVNVDDARCHARRLIACLREERDRKSTRLNSSHGYISYAVFCLKKKNTTQYLSICTLVRHGS